LAHVRRSRGLCAQRVNACPDRRRLVTRQMNSVRLQVTDIAATAIIAS
jgi:hypothetical protein